MAFNVTLWAIFLCCFAACHNFAGLAILRVGLGACEGESLLLQRNIWKSSTYNVGMKCHFRIDHCGFHDCHLDGKWCDCLAWNSRVDSFV